MPYLIRRRLVTAATTTLVGLSLGAAAPRAAIAASPCANARTPVAAASRQQIRAAVVCLVNQQRTSRGLPALHANGRLDRSAQKWTDTMVSRQKFTHGSDFAARISAVGFDWSTAGENIAVGFTTASSVVKAWMASTGHCENILDPDFKEVGTGVVNHGIRGWGGAATWTQDFGLWMGSRPPSHNWGPADGCPYG